MAENELVDCPYCKGKTSKCSKFCDECGRPRQNGTEHNRPSYLKVRVGQKEEE